MNMMFGRSKTGGVPAEDPVEPDAVADPKGYVLHRYDNAIAYYWSASSHNKHAYRQTRRLVVVLGAVLTLIASLASASFVNDRDWLDAAFSVATPVLAAVLAIVTGLSQNFQWGSAWRGMVIAAQTLQKQKDRISLLHPDEIKAVEEIDALNDVVLGETQQFFERVTGAATIREEPIESKPPDHDAPDPEPDHPALGG